MTLDVRLNSVESAFRQAWLSADDYMEVAIRQIDLRFGEGYAENHPELVAAFMRTCAQDFHTTIMKVALQDIEAAIQVLLAKLS